jgi:hypothetical protein
MARAREAIAAGQFNELLAAKRAAWGDEAPDQPRVES